MAEDIIFKNKQTKAPYGTETHLQQWLVADS